MAGIAEIFLSPLQGLLNTLQSERHYKDKNFDEALLAIKVALLQTKNILSLAGLKETEIRNMNLLSYGVKHPLKLEGRKFFLLMYLVKNRVIGKIKRFGKKIKR
ncbi:MAG: hypothetical protein COA96_15885 [SAR86 cluster bacterium]|uniref:Uncharacterized protein n=1 Tax=SAR86 cluster bacterium TaxID=2030880 RepID=A0A2A5AMC7_9GAMM|nr:MAG: hypothetical protein COA96_15885 [SAR86 cluster bacterium]